MMGESEDVLQINRTGRGVSRGWFVQCGAERGSVWDWVGVIIYDCNKSERSVTHILAHTYRNTLANTTDTRANLGNHPRDLSKVLLNNLK